MTRLQRAMGQPLSLPRLRLLVTGLTILAALALLGVILAYGATSDLPTFLEAAKRVASGETPYGPFRYLYAPWLAWLFVPATWLPLSLFVPAWHAAVAAGLCAALWPLLRTRTLEGILAATLVGAFGFHAVWAGHFEPLMVCALVYALPTRWGPVAIGIAASLKITPIVLAIRYAGRGEWGKVATAVAVAVILWAPSLLYERSGWGLPIGFTLSIAGYSPVVWAVVAFTSLVAAWRLARTRYGWLTAGVLWLAVLPRFLMYDVTGLLVTLGEQRERPGFGAADVGLRPISEDSDGSMSP